jgi:hypothetical protein
MNLLQCLRAVEPVEGLRAEDRVKTPIPHRDLLRCPLERPDARNGFDELAAHSGHRFDRNQLRAGRDELARELPGACSEVEHLRAGTDSELANEKLDRFRRIARSPAFVVVAGAVEAACGEVVNLRNQNLR